MTRELVYVDIAKIFRGMSKPLITWNQARKNNYSSYSSEERIEYDVTGYFVF